MQFCEKCGNLLIAKGSGKRVSYVCRMCGKKAKRTDKLTISETMHESKKGVIIMEKGEGIEEFPKTSIMCPTCEHMEAYWWMQQTRSADEPPTLFYRCVKCGHSWRSYG